MVGQWVSVEMEEVKPHIVRTKNLGEAILAFLATPKMAAFENIVFVQGDCLSEDSLPQDDLIAECDSVIHMVGSITDSFNYKKVL